MIQCRGAFLVLMVVVCCGDLPSEDGNEGENVVCVHVAFTQLYPSAQHLRTPAQHPRPDVCAHSLWIYGCLKWLQRLGCVGGRVPEVAIA